MYNPRQYHVIGNTVYYGDIEICQVTRSKHNFMPIDAAQAIADKLNKYYKDKMRV